MQPGEEIGIGVERGDLGTTNQCGVLSWLRLDISAVMVRRDEQSTNRTLWNVRD